MGNKIIRFIKKKITKYCCYLQFDAFSIDILQNEKEAELNIKSDIFFDDRKAQTEWLNIFIKFCIDFFLCFTFMKIPHCFLMITTHLLPK